MPSLRVFGDPHPWLPHRVFDAPNDADVLAGLADAKPEVFHRFFDEWFPRVYALASASCAAGRTPRPCRGAPCVSALAEVRTLAPATPLAAWLLSHLRREIAWARRGTPP